MTYGSVFLITPLTCLPKMDMLRFTSTLANLCLAYIFTSILAAWIYAEYNLNYYSSSLNSTSIVQTNQNSTNINPSSTITTITISTSSTTALAFFLLICDTLCMQMNAFCCQYNVLHLRAELEPRTRAKNIEKVIHAAIGICALLYLIFSIAGYRAATLLNQMHLMQMQINQNLKGPDSGPDPVTANILLSPALGSLSFIKVGILLTSFTNMLRYPLLVFPLSQTLDSWLEGVGKKKAMSSTVTVVRDRLLLNFLIGSCGLLVGDITGAMTLIACAVPVCAFLLPGLAYQKLLNSNSFLNSPGKNKNNLKVWNYMWLGHNVNLNVGSITVMAGALFLGGAILSAAKMFGLIIE